MRGDMREILDINQWQRERLEKFRIICENSFHKKSTNKHGDNSHK